VMGVKGSNECEGVLTCASTGNECGSSVMSLCHRTLSPHSVCSRSRSNSPTFVSNSLPLLHPTFSPSLAPTVDTVDMGDTVDTVDLPTSHSAARFSPTLAT
jgi:hypothetical protein